MYEYLVVVPHGTGSSRFSVIAPNDRIAAQKLRVLIKDTYGDCGWQISIRDNKCILFGTRPYYRKVVYPTDIAE